jgi:cation diffusion facilitator family transporter
MGMPRADAPMSTPTDAPSTRNDQRLAMRLSLAVGVLMLLGKVAAYLLTSSAAILSDAAESVIHVVAVGFAAFSLAVSARPATRQFPYGFERIAFFSAGFEGAMIVLAAIAILVIAIQKWLAGIALENLGTGTAFVAGAAALNGVLGWYLVRTGKRTGSIILEANGKHVLTDSWTSVGVIVGLLLVQITGWAPFDPICAIVVGLNFLWSGSQLIRRSVAGLLDYSDPDIARDLEPRVRALCDELGIAFHHVRYRHTGHRVIEELHLLFPFEVPVGRAHQLATTLEERLPAILPFGAEVFTHLEALEDHEVVHKVGAHS